jgi:catechol 2,3-dioxygenase-like lactoylglutathione lyase family enzyme
LTSDLRPPWRRAIHARRRVPLPHVLVGSIAALCSATLLGSARAAEPIAHFKGIDHVTVNVPDVARAQSWYATTLGFAVVKRNEQYVVLTRDGINLILNKAATAAPNADAETRPGYFHIALTVAASDFQASVAALRSRGIALEVGSDGDVQQAYFKDPDGNWLEIMAHAPDAATQPAAAVSWLGDVLLDHLEATDLDVRAQRHLPLEQLPDLSAEGARHEAEFNRDMLARLDRIPAGTYTHEQRLLAGLLRHTFASAATADQDYWYRFAVTPYAGGRAIHGIHELLATAPLASAADRDGYLKLIDSYVEVVKAMATKTRAQADRGIRVPQPALPGVLATLKGLRTGSAALFDAAGDRVPATAAASFKTLVHEKVVGAVVPAYDALIAVLDADYVKRAPSAVGVGHFPAARTTTAGASTPRPDASLSPRPYTSSACIESLSSRRSWPRSAPRLALRATVAPSTHYCEPIRASSRARRVRSRRVTTVTSNALRRSCRATSRCCLGHHTVSRASIPPPSPG